MESIAVLLNVKSLDEIFIGKPVRKHVTQFSYVIAGVMVLVAFYLVYRGKHFDVAFGLGAAAGAMLILGLFSPRILLPVWKSWTMLGHMLGMVMTPLILAIFWVLAVLPTALFLRVTGRKVMETAFRAPVSTYWIDRDPKLNDFKLLERQH